MTINEIKIMGYDFERNEKEYPFGLRRDGDQFDIFLIKSEAAYELLENAPSFCQRILDQYAPDKNLSDINWTYTAGPVHSDLNFKSYGGFAVTMTFENVGVLQSYCQRSIEDYQRALDDPRGIEAALADGYPKHLNFKSDPVSYYLLHTPEHQHPIHIWNHPYQNLPDDKYPVLLADAQKFIAYWKKTSALPPLDSSIKGRLASIFGMGAKHSEYDADDQRLLNSSLETSLKYYVPNEMPTSVGLNFKGKISFNNGRHRTVNAANLGAPYIPMQVEKRQLQQLKDMFEWQPVKGVSFEHGGFDV